MKRLLIFKMHSLTSKSFITIKYPSLKALKSAIKVAKITGTLIDHEKKTFDARELNLKIAFQSFSIGLSVIKFK